MNRLTKGDSERRDRYVADLREAKEAIDQAVADVNALIADKITPAIEAYNEKLEEVRGWCEDNANSIDDAISAKSEKWQEGERGQAMSAWKDEWEGIDLSDIEPVPDIEEVTVSHADDLEAINSAPEGDY